MELSKLAPNKGKKRGVKRRGRGESSGHGKTSCRGGKGQTARSGGKIPSRFEGGQMPLYRRLPKIGFYSRKGILGLNSHTVINLDVLEKFDNGSTVDCEALVEKGGVTCARDTQAGIKILGSGTLTKKLTVKVQAISESAKAKIESLGGSVEIV